ncbi:MAG TPA: phage tail protein [Ignavibacteriaceae bacterium]|nr:phage tail protein [Ignavibacteriaceae bacterium]
MPQYPLPSFHFKVEWGGNRIGFSEVSGLSVETSVIEYREGGSPDYSVIKMPGLKKYNNITLKRGMIKGDNDFFNWWNSQLAGTAERRDIVISILDQEHAPAAVWKARNAFPVKIEWGPLNASGNEIVIESMEIAHEGLTLEND